LGGKGTEVKNKDRAVSTRGCLTHRVIKTGKGVSKIKAGGKLSIKRSVW